MDPIFIILFAVIVTLLLTLAFPRLHQASPAVRRALWILFIIGGLALLVVAWLAFHSSGGPAAFAALAIWLG